MSQALVKASMMKLKMTLQSETSRYVLILIAVVLFFYAKTSFWVSLTFLILLVVIWKISKPLFWMSMIVVSLFFGRMIIPLNSTDSEVLSGVISKVEEEYLILRTNQTRVIVYLSDSFAYVPGDRIQMEGSLYEPEIYDIEHQFDYESYLLSLGVSEIYYASEIRVIDHQFSFMELHTILMRKIDATYDRTVAMYLKMILLGDDSAMEDDILSSFRGLMIAHIFAISGMHITLILGFISWILSFFFLKKDTLRVIQVIFIIFILFVVGFQLSTIRASLFAGILMFPIKKRGYMSKLDVLSIIALSFLFYRPYILTNTAFQLSFLITGVLILFQEKLRETKGILSFLKIQMIAISFSLPILLSMNHELSIVSFISGFFFYQFYLIIWIPFSLLVIFIPSMSSFYNSLIILFEDTIQLFNLGNITFSFEFSNTLSILLYYIAIFLCFYLIFEKKPWKKAVYLMVLSFAISYFHTNNPFISKVVFFDVGSADAIFIHEGNINVLIDTGKEDDYQTIINYLLGENIHSLDAVFITHDHSDHIGGLDILLEKIEVKELYLSHEESSYPNGIILSVQDQVVIGGYSFMILHSGIDSDNENNNSLVIYTMIDEYSFLFMGDLESDEEEKILTLLPTDIDVLKVGHHGSTTSTTEELLDRTNPKYAMISVGNNSYGHPTDKILERLQEYQIKTWRTDEEGSITVQIDCFTSKLQIHHYQKGISFLEKRLW